MSALERLVVVHDHATLEAEPVSGAQAQTRDAFGCKRQRRESYEHDAMQQFSRKWLLERYCGGDAAVLDTWLAAGRKIILDAGCGSGYSALLLFGDELRNHDYLGVDISAAVDVARERFSERGIVADLLRSDLSAIAIPDGSVDIILAEGVLHHTDDTRASFQALVRKLNPGGRFLFCVYARKGVIREFADDYIRAQLRPLTDEEAWDALRPVTLVGKTLGELGVTIDVPADIPMRRIRAGSYDLQRFIYWHFLKTYYHPVYDIEAMNHINFDWYRPANRHRYTPDEVQDWCTAEGMTIERLDVQEAGITVVAGRP